MSIGFRPTQEDSEIIQAHKRPDESTTDVLRRALRALDRERWEQQAREDMERIAASGEDLSDEPDDWGYDAEDRFVDLRGGAERRDDDAGRRPPVTGEQPVQLGAARRWLRLSPDLFRFTGEGLHDLHHRLMAETMGASRERTSPLHDVDIALHTFANDGAVLEYKYSSERYDRAVRDLAIAAEDATRRPAEVAVPRSSEVAVHRLAEKQRSPAPPKVARLRAAVRRASKR